MAWDVESLKLVVGDQWALTGDRQDPEEFGIDRAEGFNILYEQLRSGFYPPRTLENQLRREEYGFFKQKGRQGVPEWHATINYFIYAFCIGPMNGGLYVCDIANGPATNNVTDPEASNNSIWRKY